MSGHALNYRFIVLGVLLIVIGGLFLAFPGILTSPSAAYDHTLLVRVAPDNYSYIQKTLGPQQTLRVTLSSSPEGVDFFLMNSSNFATWTSGRNEPANVYPQSRLDARNYSFTATAPGTSENYSLVFVSRFSNMSTSVLLHLVIDQEASILDTAVVPLIFVSCGVALMLFGATRRKKAVAVPTQAEETQGGGFLGLFGVSEDSKSCRFCGHEMPSATVLCPSCGKSQR
jgi:hypothetical protein